MLFIDRFDAGMRLAERVKTLGLRDPVVLGLPRGGVVVAAQIAETLGSPLDVIVVRKLRAPWHPELAIGAIAEGGFRSTNEFAAVTFDLTASEIAAIAERETAELHRQVRIFRQGRAAMGVKGRTVLVVDDGVATGSTAEVAAKVMRSRGATRLILAVPVGSREAISTLRGGFDEIVCLETPEPFGAVGQWYQDFEQVEDATVVFALAEAAVRVRSDRSLPLEIHPARRVGA